MSKINRRWVVSLFSASKFLAFPCVVMLAMLIMGCQMAKEQATPTPIPTPIVAEKPTYTVQRGAVQKVMQFSARVSPLNEQGLFFKSSGYIKEVYKLRDESVKKGDIIAELEIDALLNQLAQAQVNLEKAQVTLDSAKESLARQLADSKANLEMREIRLKKAQEQEPSLSTRIAKLRLDEAEAVLQQAQSNYDRIAWQPGASASPAARALQAATTSYEIAKTNYELALQNEKGYKYDLEVMRKELELAKLKHSWLEQGIDPNLTKAVEQAQLTIQRSEEQIAASRMVSPMDGVLANISAVKGRMAEAFKTLAVVSNPEEVEITAQLSDSDMTNLKLDMPVTATLSSLPGNDLTGKITKLPYPFGGGGTTEKLDKQDTYTHITLDSRDVQMKVGDMVKVSVLLERTEDTLWLSPAAVRTFEGRNFVVVQAENRQRRIDIKVGIKGSDRIEVLEGLQEGQTVISQ